VVPLLSFPGGFVATRLTLSFARFVGFVKEATFLGFLRNRDRALAADSVPPERLAASVSR
jgi:hypothetical protein